MASTPDMQDAEQREEPTRRVVIDLGLARKPLLQHD